MPSAQFDVAAVATNVCAKLTKHTILEKHRIGITNDHGIQPAIGVLSLITDWCLGNNTL